MAFSVGKEELSEPVPLLKKLSAEFLGTMLLVIFGCGAAAGQGNENSKTMVRMKQSYLICLSLFIPDSTLDRLVHDQDVRTHNIIFRVGGPWFRNCSHGYRVLHGTRQRR